MIFREGWGLEGAKEGENLGSGSPPPSPSSKMASPTPPAPNEESVAGMAPLLPGAGWLAASRGITPN